MSVPVILHHGHRSERNLIRGYDGRAVLYRVVDADNRATVLEGRGLVITDRLADKLGVRVGDSLEVEVLEGLSPGDTVVRHAAAPLRAGSAVDVVESLEGRRP